QQQAAFTGTAAVIGGGVCGWLALVLTLRTPHGDEAPESSVYREQSPGADRAPGHLTSATGHGRRAATHRGDEGYSDVRGGRHLVIVEPPANARPLARYLGEEHGVHASVGHRPDIPALRDLPADMKKGPYGKFGVNVEGDFEPYYIVSPDKKKTVSELKKALKDADTLYLATDEDR